MMQLSGVFTEVLAVLPSTGGYRSPVVRHCPTFADSKSLPSSGFFKSCHPFSVPKLGIRSYKSRLRSFTVRAAATSEGDFVPVAPLQFESPTCQLLARVLQMHPHLLPAAIDQQLENLQGDGDAQG